MTVLQRFTIARASAELAGKAAKGTDLASSGFCNNKRSSGRSSEGACRASLVVLGARQAFSTVHV